MQQFHGQIALLQNEMERWRNEKYIVLFAADGNERIVALERTLQDYDITSLRGEPKEPGIYLVDANLSQNVLNHIQKLNQVIM